MLYEISVGIFISFWLLCGRLSYKISLWESERNSCILCPPYLNKKNDTENKFIAIISFILGIFSLIAYFIDGSWKNYCRHVLEKD